MEEVNKYLQAAYKRATLRFMEASEYLRRIGKRGGEKKSEAKTEAARENLKKAREALSKSRKGKKKR